MGILLSRFKNKPSTKQVLEDIEKKLKNIDEFQQNTIERQKRIAKKLLVIFVVVYIVAIAAFVLISSVQRYKLYYFSGLVIFAIISWLSHKLIKWHYTRQMVSNSEKSVELRKKKKKILEEVMDTETYKVAKELLDRFGDKPQQNHLELKPVHTPSPALRQNMPGSELRQRHVEANKGPPPRSSTPAQPNIPANISNPMRVPQPPQHIQQAPRVLNASFGQPPARPLPRPILPRERGMVDRMMDFLVGDGPHQRYALICRHCSSHNGMALQEEFEYISFYCCYCFQFNPPRKMRPMGPRLPLAAPPQLPNLTTTTSANQLNKQSENVKQSEESSEEETENLGSDEETSEEETTESSEEKKPEDANQTSEKMDIDSDENKAITESTEEESSIR